MEKVGVKMEGFRGMACELSGGTTHLYEFLSKGGRAVGKREELREEAETLDLFLTQQGETSEGGDT